MASRHLFGTDGIRGKAGEPPLDEGTVRIVGRALARTLAGRLGRLPRVVIGRDTRESGEAVESALNAGLRAEGAVADSSGVITTPGVACITRLEGYDAGIVISASHNPFRDNGIKVFSPSGQKLDDSAESEIERLVDEIPSSDDAWPSLEVNPSHAEAYLAYLRHTVAADLDLHGVSVVLDCANGAAYELAPRLFASLGATISTIGVTPDGRNINEGCGSLHLEALSTEVRRSGANLGVAFDGDADRALFVDSTGAQVDGDSILYLLAMDLDARGDLAGRRVVATVMSNIGLELALAAHGIALARTPVGDKYVLDELLVRGGSIGGEQSGHIIFPQISLAGDGMITALEVLGAMGRSGRSLGELAAGMERYPQILVNIPVRAKRPFDEIPDVASVSAEVERELEGSGRLLLRYSGTENLARVMIEGKDPKTIADQAQRIADALRKALGANDASAH